MSIVRVTYWWKSDDWGKKEKLRKTVEVFSGKVIDTKLNIAYSVRGEKLKSSSATVEIEFNDVNIANQFIEKLDGKRFTSYII